MFLEKKEKVISIYFTAGYPSFDSVEEIIFSLERNGADMIEIGIPFSDPLADGPVIQETSRIALENGMTLKKLFHQLRDIRKKISVPLLLMGYINPIMRFGFDDFCRTASETGIDGLIIPDLPMREYLEYFKNIITDCNLKNIFLVTPDTSMERLREINELSTGFIYVVSSASTTGKTGGSDLSRQEYFKNISSSDLKNPTLAGFGIHNRETKDEAFRYLQGVIIGSAYMRALQLGKSIEECTFAFMKAIK